MYLSFKSRSVNAKILFQSLFHYPLRYKVQIKTVFILIWFLGVEQRKVHSQVIKKLKIPGVSSEDMTSVSLVVAVVLSTQSFNLTPKLQL